MDSRISARPDRRVGTRVAGRYRLVTHLADGGMGSVWCAHDEVLHRDVALKFLRDDLAADDAVLARFRNEARTAASLSHPDIAQLHDYVERTWEDPPEVFLAMELVRGHSLADELRARPRPDATFVRHVLEHAAAALGAAHRVGVVHRDVKPGNLLLDDAGQVKLTDFGIARAMEASSITQDGYTTGTAPYMAPEQARGETVGPWSDVYALGVVAFEMLAGRRPFEGLRRRTDPTPALPGDGMDAELARLVEDCLRPEPADRPRDGDQVMARLRGLRTGRGVPIAPVANLRAAATSADAADVATRIMPVTQAEARAPLAATSVSPRAAVVQRSSGRRRAGWVALAAVLAVAAGLVALTRGDEADQGSGASSAPTAAGAVTGAVDVRRDDVVGRSADDVALWFRTQGLEVITHEVPTDDVAAGSVVDVTPIGSVPIGSTIDLGVATPTSQASVVSVAPTPPSAPPDTASPPAEGAKGNGKAKGKGKPDQDG
jgi:serine/threonine-protein kinase